MIIAFTICSNNYLAQAAILTNSIKQTNPDIRVIVGLVDKKNELIDYSVLNTDVVEISNIGIPNFDDLWLKYDIVELNTSVKASMFKYVFNIFPDAYAAYYFDPDIQVFESLEPLNDLFTNNDILLTPHVLTEVPLDGKSPGENIFLNYGIYNLGFIGLKSNKMSKEVFRLLDWWEERLLKHGFNRPSDGYFVDQLWMNLVPIYYRNVVVVHEMGYNAGPWNLHERKELQCLGEGHFVMPDRSKLFFYHFSNYKPNDKFLIAAYYDRIEMRDYPCLTVLYMQYYDLLNNYNVDTFRSFDCYYVVKRKEYLDELQSKKKELGYKKIANLLTPPIVMNILKKGIDGFKPIKSRNN